MPNCNSDPVLWEVCSLQARRLCESAKQSQRDINSTIHPFKTLVPIHHFDIDTWDEVENVITLAIYNLALLHVAENMPKILSMKSCA